MAAPAANIDVSAGGNSAARKRGSLGSSLMEMVVVLAILSLLAAMATPYALKSVKREKEVQLRETLRTVRTAIDRFHADMEGSGAGQNGGTPISENGYPLSLQALGRWRGKDPRR